MSSEAPVWFIAASVSTFAAAIVAPSDTPIDRSLPVLALCVVLIAAIIRDSHWAPAILAGVPLLLAAAIALPDAEGPRLLCYGAILSVSFCGALLTIEDPAGWQLASFAAIGLFLLRWVAREKMEVGREVVIAVGVIAIITVMPRSALSVAVALAAAIWTPAIPSHTAVIPLAIAAVVWVIPWRARIAPLAIIGSLILVFPWSGAFARGLPYFFRRTATQPARVSVRRAVAPGETVDFDVPVRCRAVVVSLANGLKFRKGMVVGSIDGAPLRVGQVADWGATRREVWWHDRLSLPQQPAGIVRGYGYDAWIDGAARIPIAAESRVRVSMSRDLPPNSRLQVEGFEP